MQSVLIVACFDLLFTETVPMSPKVDYISHGDIKKAYSNERIMDLLQNANLLPCLIDLSGLPAPLAKYTR